MYATPSSTTAGNSSRPAERDAPHGLERRPQPDVDLRLRARRRRAVHRPLQLGTEDAHRHLAEVLEVLLHRASREPVCADRDVEVPPARYVDLCDAVDVGTGAAIPEMDERPTDARAVVAVDDGDDELRRLIPKRRVRQRPVEAERGPERRARALVPTPAGCETGHEQTGQKKLA